MLKFFTYIFFFLLSFEFLKAEQVGKASWYSVKTNHGTRTASGKKLNDNEFVAAHRRLPFGTKVKITNLNNNKSCIATIIDRGPYTKGRVIDVSLAVAKKIGFHKNGITKVKIEKL